MTYSLRQQVADLHCDNSVFSPEATRYLVGLAEVGTRRKPRQQAIAFADGVLTQDIERAIYAEMKAHCPDVPKPVRIFATANYGSNGSASYVFEQIG